MSRFDAFLLPAILVTMVFTLVHHSKYSQHPNTRAPASDLACFEATEKLLGTNEWNPALFSSSLKIFLSKGTPKHFGDFSKPEEWLAAIEASSATSDHLVFDFASNWNQIPVKEQQKIIEMLKRFKTNNTNPERFREFVTKLYEETHPSSLWNQIPNSTNINRFLVQRIESELALGASGEAFERAGLLASPTMLGNWKTFVRTHEKDFQLLTSLALDLPSVLGGQMPPYLPILRLRPDANELKELSEVLRTSGWNAFEQSLINQYKNQASLEVGLRWAQRVYYSVMIAWLADTAAVSIMTSIESSHNDAQKKEKTIQDLISESSGSHSLPQSPSQAREDVIQSVLSNVRISMERNHSPEDQIEQSLRVMEERLRSSCSH